MARQRAGGLAAVLLGALALLLVLAAPAPGATPDPAATASPGAKYQYTPIKSGQYLPLDEIPKTAQVVRVGVYPIDVYDIDFESNTCYITAYVWLIWTGDIDPLAGLELANSVEEWGTMSTPAYEEPIELPDGSTYQSMRVNGRFYQPYDLRRFPLDKQKISIYIEDSARSYDQVVFVADRENTGIDAGMVIPGWHIHGFTSETLVHDYLTNFGDTSITSSSKYTSLLYQITIERNANYFLWKLLFPLVIVLLTNWLALLLRPNWIDLRTAMPATALLTTVFLQESYSSGLPDVSYLVLMDKIYVVAYVMIIATLAMIIWSNHKLRSSPYAEVVEKVRRADVVGAAVQFVAFWVILALIVFT